MIVINSGRLVFLVENDILDGLACRLPVFLRKGETNQNRHSNVIILEERVKGMSRAVKIW